MTLNLKIAQTAHMDFTPRITVIGVGGGGTNAVDNMIALNLPGVDFVVANTDAQQLQLSRSERRIQLGPHMTQGNGAGGRPEVGKASAEEAADELDRHLENTHMVFITAGMGGGTGTGAAPVIARMARDRNILTIGVVTKPFAFEGKRRMRLAEQGIAELQLYVDTLIVIPNQNLFKVSTDRTGWKEAFEMANHVLYMGVRGVTDLMVVPGVINLDYADIRTVMSEMGKAMMGTGEMDGEDRALRAAEAAINNPLLEDTNMKGARGLLINITGGSDISLFEVDQAVNRISEEVDEDANIMFGMALDEGLNGRMRISVVATGIDSAAPNVYREPVRLVANSVSAEPVPFPAQVTAAAAPIPAAAPIAPAAPSPHAAPAAPVQGAGFIPVPPIRPLLSSAYQTDAELALNDGEVRAASIPGAQPARAALPAALRPAEPRQAEPRPAPVVEKRQSLFNRFLRGAAQSPAPAAGARHYEPVMAPVRVEPAAEMPHDAAPREPARAAVRQANLDEAGLEIPAFLRRST